MSRVDVMDLFPDLVQPEPNSGCWLWIAGANTSGYGMLTANGKKICAHRVSYSISFGKIPDGILVLHKCDNPLCCNPGHLELGDQSKNMQDAYDRCRKLKMFGTQNGRAKLTVHDVNEIMKLKGPFNRSIRDNIAKRFGVTSSTIYRVRRGEWRQ